MKERLLALGLLGALLIASVALGIAFSPSPRRARAEDGAKPGTPAPLPERTAQAVERGFRWLGAQQNKNGSFGIIPGAPEEGEVGFTGLALRALAEAPEAIRAKHAETLKKAAGYLLGKQAADGSITNEKSGLTTYRTSIALMGLIAYGRTSAERAAEVDSAAAKARDFVAKSQFSEENGGIDPKSPYYGGFGYDKTGDKPAADLSNTHFALAALKEAGVPPDSPVWKRAVAFLQRCQNRSESNDLPSIGIKVRPRDDGGFMYDPGLGRRYSPVAERPDGSVEIASYASMSCAGLMGLLHASVDRNDPRVKAAYGWIRSNYTLEENIGLGSKENPKAGKQGLYYYYLAFARALDAWGEPTIELASGEKRTWAADLAEKLCALQREDGTWANEEPRWWEQNPLLCTLYALNALHVCQSRQGA